MRQTPAGIRAAAEAACERVMAVIEEGQQTMRALHGRQRAASFRATAAPDFTPPDIYAKPLAALRLSDARAAAARTYQPAPRPTEMHLDAHGVPDPYFFALEAMRKENR